MVVWAIACGSDVAQCKSTSEAHVDADRRTICFQTRRQARRKQQRQDLGKNATDRDRRCTEYAREPPPRAYPRAYTRIVERVTSVRHRCWQEHHRVLTAHRQLE